VFTIGGHDLCYHPPRKLVVLNNPGRFSCRVSGSCTLLAEHHVW